MRECRKFICKNYWNLYLLFNAIVFLFVRMNVGEDESLIGVYTDVYHQNRVLGFYILVYIILLIPLCRNFRIHIWAIRYGSHERQMKTLIGRVISRAASYSFVLNFLFYFIVGTKTTDWTMKENIIRVCILFFTQMTGWCVISFIYILFYFWTGHAIFAVCFSQFVVTLFNLANYVKFYKKIEYYVRMYYFMFHIEVFPSVSCLVSCIALYFMVMVFLGMGVYKRLCNYDFL